MTEEKDELFEEFKREKEEHEENKEEESERHKKREKEEEERHKKVKEEIKGKANLNELQELKERAKELTKERQSLTEDIRKNLHETINALTPRKRMSVERKITIRDGEVRRYNRQGVRAKLSLSGTMSEWRKIREAVEEAGEEELGALGKIHRQLERITGKSDRGIIKTNNCKITRKIEDRDYSIYFKSGRKSSYTRDAGLKFKGWTTSSYSDTEDIEFDTENTQVFLKILRHRENIRKVLEIAVDELEEMLERWKEVKEEIESISSKFLVAEEL